jgi:ech hydrogenase subunit A
MQGVMKIMPFTTTIMVIGMISMLMPPFGVLITKWLAIEASISMPVILILIALGSACTVAFWSKWIGIVLTMSYKPKYNVEKIAGSIKFALAFLFALVFVVCVGIAPLYSYFIDPQIHAFNLTDKFQMIGSQGGIWLLSSAGTVVGGFGVLAVFVIIFFLLLAVPYFMGKGKSADLRAPYMCGENIGSDLRGLEYTGPGEKPAGVAVRNYYLTGVFGEEKLTLAFNLIAGAIILLMICVGVVVK